MPSLRCRGCKRLTNTAVSDAYEQEPYGVAEKCYAAYVDGKWVEGCGLKKTDRWLRASIMALVKGTKP